MRKTIPQRHPDPRYYETPQPDAGSGCIMWGAVFVIMVTVLMAFLLGLISANF